MRGLLAALALGIFAAVVIARWPLLARPFSSEGEAREAHVIADVVREGHWIAPYPNGDWIPTKGPLLYWWAGAAAMLFGLSERVLRLSVAALNLGTILATAWLGRTLVSPTAGWLAALLLASCVLFSGYAFYLRVDTALLLCTTLSLGFFARELARPETALGSRLGSHVALAGALFAKGLPALIPTLVPMLAVLAWRRDRSGLRCYALTALLLGAVTAASFSPALCAALLPLALALAFAPALGARSARETLAELAPGLVLVGLVGGWLALADARYPVPYLTRVVEDSMNRVGRAAMAGDPFLRSPWYYFPRFPGDFFPWAIFLPVGLLAAVRAVRRDRRDLGLLCLVCLVGGFAVFSAIAYKRKVYLLPIFPPAAVLVASLLENPRAERRGLDASFGVFAALGAAAACLAPLDLASRALRGASLYASLHADELSRTLQAHALGVDLAGLACGALWLSARPLWRTRGGSAGGASIAAGMAILLVGPMTELELARAKQPRTPADFAGQVRELVSSEDELRFVPGVRDEGLLFYLARPVPATSSAELETLLSGAESRDRYLIARRASELAGASAPLTTLARGVGSNGPLILVRVTGGRH
ncbi:MAG TPA: glycosyltransferase family 39 protein [Myxococcota bacterium]|nr:glycosyltransferase family 39 protein [Myxococcota bacterium]